MEPEITAYSLTHSPAVVEGKSRLGPPQSASQPQLDTNDKRSDHEGLVNRLEARSEGLPAFYLPVFGRQV